MAHANHSLAHPEFRLFLSAFPGLPSHKAPNDPDGGMRAALAASQRPPLPDPSRVELSDLHVDGPDGVKIRLLVVRPAARVRRQKKEGELEPVVLVIHGGGFVTGTPEMDFPMLAYFAEHGLTSISPEYRLAPEHPFPAAFDDVAAAYDWLVRPSTLANHGFDPSRLALFGSSAGSTLASYLAIRSAKAALADQPGGAGDNRARLKLVFLDSPNLDPSPAKTEGSPASLGGELDKEGYSIWSNQNTVDMEPYIFPHGAAEASKDGVSAFANTLSVSALRELRPFLPPHHLQICERDVLRQGGIEYAHKLLDAGVSTGVRVWRGCTHAFISINTNLEIADKARAETVRAILDAFEW